MQVTGTIQSVFATQEGGYQPNQGDYVYTFNMAIDTPQGPMNGVIGSKTQPYPMAPGQPITVDVRQTDHGPKFKKINPQYAGQQQGGQRQGPPQQQQPQQPNQPDWDEIAKGKVRHGLVCAGIQSGQLPANNIEVVDSYLPYILTGKLPIGYNTTGGDPNPDYNPNPQPPAPGDDVPF
ncbi:hypothetical protein LCGC14_1188140 [marine sediment metagenome]|uniref:Uncharacterized protein n=1 Tax=marine sediment metagenome TaxID=412755 RepID=A0A0F9LQ14_9ZZZZ